MRQSCLSILVIANALLTCSGSKEMNVMSFETLPGFFNPNYTVSGVILDVSRVRCCEQCAVSNGCVLVNYNKVTRECHLAASTATFEHFIPDSTWTILFDRNGSDACSSSPCLNGGSCVGGINTYNCTCSTGWTGIHCETSSDACSSSPCLNGGSCVGGINTYNCTCSTGWTGIHCNTSDPVSCPTGYSHTSGTSCYEVRSETLNYTDSAALCNAYSGGHLVDLKTEDESAFIETLLTNEGIEGYFWIGLNDIVNDGVYRWSDGSLPGYTNWEPGQPDRFAFNEICGELSIYFGGWYYWHDFPCDVSQSFICEFP